MWKNIEKPTDHANENRYAEELFINQNYKSMPLKRDFNRCFMTKFQKYRRQNLWDPMRMRKAKEHDVTWFIYI